ncbi:MAG: hypothetical protein AAFO79_04645, partial [Pseudomonadota bacterium]
MGFPRLNVLIQGLLIHDRGALAGPVHRREEARRARPCNGRAQSTGIDQDLFKWYVFWRRAELLCPIPQGPFPRRHVS